MALACAYMVVSVPIGCTTYWVGEIVYLPCNPPCPPTVIHDGSACAGTGLYPLTTQCISD
jgi:hypothetical protein